MKDEKCLFCRIAAGEEPGERVWEDEEFLCLKNKYPTAPIHLLVMPKDHIRKQKTATSGMGEFWGKILSAVFLVVRQLKLDQTAFKLVINGRGYAHFEHEHIHILGGSESEPGGAT